VNNYTQIDNQDFKNYQLVSYNNSYGIHKIDPQEFLVRNTRKNAILNCSLSGDIFRGALSFFICFKLSTYDVDFNSLKSATSFAVKVATIKCECDTIQGFYNCPASDLIVMQNSKLPTAVIENFKSSIAVIGAGVIGLTTGLKLLEKGYRVTIYYDKNEDTLTSTKAAAFCMPFLCTDTSTDIIRDTFKYYEKLYERIVPEYLSKGKCLVLQKNYEKSCSWFTIYGVDTTKENKFEFSTYLIETYTAMQKLRREFSDKGGIFFYEHIKSLEDLKSRKYSNIINCAGIGAKELVNDNCLESIRGDLLWIKKEVFEKTTGYWPAGDDYRVIIQEDEPLSYVVFHTNVCVLGGTSQRTTNLKSGKEFKHILHVCAELLSKVIIRKETFTFNQLNNLNEKEFSATVGLRPVRSKGNRLEKDENIIHNYGHGGSGYTLCWGCAEKVVELLTDKKTEPSKAQLSDHKSKSKRTPVKSKSESFNIETV